MIQAQAVAQKNAELAQGEKNRFTLGEPETIKAALREAGHEDCRGSFRIAANTMATLEKFRDLWNGLMNESARKVGFATAQQGNRVCWAGGLLRTFETS